jgi:hypothetical protein
MTDRTPPPAAPADDAEVPAPNRATRRGKAGRAVPSGHARGAPPHPHGAQGRRILPIRRTG